MPFLQYSSLPFLESLMQINHPSGALSYAYVHKWKGMKFREFYFSPGHRSPPNTSSCGRQSKENSFFFYFFFMFGCCIHTLVCARRSFLAFCLSLSSPPLPELINIHVLTMNAFLDWPHSRTDCWPWLGKEANSLSLPVLSKKRSSRVVLHVRFFSLLARHSRKSGFAVARSTLVAFRVWLSFVLLGSQIVRGPNP